MNNLSLKIRLIAMNFLIYAVWGTYLSSLGIYLGNIGMGTNIGAFFALQGIVSLFMPALMGIVADKWIPAQKLLGICQGLAGIFMGMAGFMGMTYGPDVTFAQLFPFYAVSVAFFMPTVALGISVSYNALERNGLDTMSTYPPIRVFGTIGFIVSMWIVDLTDFKSDYRQLLVSAAWSLVLAAYAFTLPACPTSSGKRSTSIVEALGLRAFTLFGNRQMRQFFIFSFLLGMCLQVTFGFSGTFMSDFGRTPEFADAFAVRHNVLLSSLSQISETLCILLIPFFLKRLGIKKVMLIAMFAWMCRFGFFGLGNPEGGVWLFVLSMIVYGVAFDFFNISGSLFVDQNTTDDIRSSAQGVFMMMTNGLGATVGSLVAQQVVNHFVYTPLAADTSFDMMQGWSIAWYVFAGFALVVAIAFAIIFKYKHVRN